MFDILVAGEINPDLISIVLCKTEVGPDGNADQFDLTSN